MFLKKVLNQPNVVGTVMIALLFCAGFVYAFTFNGFNVETIPGSEVEAWLASASGGSSGSSGGGGTDDMPPESPTPENPEDEGDPPEDEGDPPEDEGIDPALPPEDEDPLPCDCDTSTDKLHSCGCDNKNWGQIMRTKKVNGKRKQVWTGEYGWVQPCGGLKVPYPCPTNCDRRAHIGDDKTKNHCPCPHHPRHSDPTTGPFNQDCRKNWTVCKINNQPTHCSTGRCKNQKKK